MSRQDVVRLWLGWRAHHLAKPGDWQAFKTDLARTFIPATWQMMAPHGLTTYVPSVMGPTQGAGMPEEIALLCYRSKEAYASRENTVLGRAYSPLHRALFEFDDTARRSVVGWAEAPAAGKPALRQGTAGSAHFSDSNAVVHVMLVSSTAPNPATQVVLGALGAHSGSIAVWCQRGFAAIWLAAPGTLDKAATSAPVLAALPGAKLVAFHRAVDAPKIEEEHGVPVVEQQSWHFRR